MRRERWRREGHTGDYRERHVAHLFRVPRVVMPLAMSLALTMVWAVAATAVSRAPAVRAASTAQVTILTPAVGSDNSAQGPVGANVTIQAAGLTPQTPYAIGVAVAPGGCVSEFISVTDQPVTTDANGAFTTTFVWPSTAAAVGSSYYICAQITAPPGSPAIQSQQVYIVRSASPPAITIKPSPQVSASGTPVPIPPQGSNRYYASEPITISGQNFVPGGQNLSAYLSTQKITSGSQLQSAVVLQTVDGSAITPDANGSFTTTVTLPAPQVAQPNKYYVYVVSQDSQGGSLPSLMADKQITIIPQPTPTPTVTVAPTSTAATQPPTPPGTGGGGSNIGVIIGLGVTSVLLFVLGVILLASAAAMPRPQR